MCQPNHAHPQAAAEIADIVSKGNYTQRSVAAAAWTQAYLACCVLDQTAFTNRLVVPNKGVVLTLEEHLGLTTGIAVAALYGGGEKRCMDLFASDVSASPWWHGSQPVVRAVGRMP